MAALIALALAAKGAEWVLGATVIGLSGLRSLRLVSVVSKLVAKDSLRLMPPELDEKLVVLDDISRRPQDALKDSADVPHVKDVVELCWSGQKVLLYPHPNLERRVGELSRSIHDGDSLGILLSGIVPSL